MQDQSMTDQVNRQNVKRKNTPVRSMADRLRDFTSMNPPISSRSKTLEDPQEFVDEVKMIFVDMGASNTEKGELAFYQAKDVAQTWCQMWQERRVLGGLLFTWELFKTDFPDRFFSRGMRKAKVEECINLKQGSMSVRVCSLNFVKL